MPKGALKLVGYELFRIMWCVEKIKKKNDGQKFNTFSCSIWYSEWEPKSSLLDTIT